MGGGFFVNVDSWGSGGISGSSEEFSEELVLLCLRVWSVLNPPNECVCKYIN